MSHRRRLNRKSDLVLQKLEKAVHAGNLTDLVPEDLEVEAHNTLWSDADPTELTILKLLPETPATSVSHEYTKVTSFGFDGNSGFFAERSLPPETNIGTERVVETIKLMGEIGPTFLLAALEKTQRALNTSGAQNIERAALRLNMLRKKARNIYFSDTSKTRAGDAGLRFRGLLQQIREGTDGTDGDASPYGSHVIDMRGDPLTPETIRDRAAKSVVLFGMFNCLVMDPLVRSDFEGRLDAAERLPMPIAARPYMLGQSIGGIQTQGSRIRFHTDNTLTPVYSRPQYKAELVDGGPTGLPTVTASAGADGSSPDDSLFTSSDAGNYAYVVTEMIDELEGAGTRAPATGWLAVASGQEVTLSLTPSSTRVDSFKVYRLSQDAGDSALTDAWFIFEVAAASGGATVTAYDDNLYLPDTSTAFGLNLRSRSAQALAGTDSYYSVAEKSAQFLKNNDSPRNTVAMASLGPSMGIMALASIIAEVDRPLMYSACTPLVRNPYQQVAFINVGRLA